MHQELIDTLSLAGRVAVITGAASGDLPEVGEFDLECDGTGAETGALAVSPNLSNNLLKRCTRSFEGKQIGGKCVLGADGFAHPVGTDRPLVDASRYPVITRATQ